MGENESLTSFPDHSHLQYLSMQIRRVKAWEIWSHAVTSCRQRRHIAMSPMAGGQNISKAASIPLVIHDAMDVSAQNGNYYPPPPCVYLLSTWYNHMLNPNTEASTPHHGNSGQMSSDECRGVCQSNRLSQKVPIVGNFGFIQNRPFHSSFDHL